MHTDYYHFQCITHAKWILTGEHSVLRQGDAIVFPLPSKTFTLSYQKQKHALQIQLPKATRHEKNTLVQLSQHTIEYGLNLLKQPQKSLIGTLHIEQNFPMGMGLGFSAALCVSLAKWFVWQGWLKTSDVFTLSKQMEHFLHGTSSGVDIAGVSNDAPIYYNASGQHDPIALTWYPIIYLSHAQKQSLTTHSITKVERGFKQDPKLAAVIDRSMHYSSVNALRALTSPTSNERLTQLACSIEEANQCFQQWGLIPKNVAKHMNILKQNGALATKPTGAGNGGYVLSLWGKALPKDHTLPFEMIAT